MPIEADARELARAPVLFLSGHGEMRLSPETRRSLRGFVDAGGFLFAEACCSDASFDRSFRAECARLWPDAALEPLAAGHDVYAAKHRLEDARFHVLDGVRTGCRTGVVYSPRGFSCALDGYASDAPPEKRLARPDAERLAVNLAAYALAWRDPVGRLKKPRLAGIDPPLPAKPGAVRVGQLVHGGDWQPWPGMLESLSDAAARAANTPLDLSARRVEIGKTDLYDYPALYMGGVRAFEFDADEVGKLRAYLERGGFLFAEACCGSGEFDRAFRALARRLFPDAPLEELDEEHPALHAPYDLSRVEFTKPVPAAIRRERRARIEAVRARGRVAILYSRLGFSHGVVGRRCPPTRGYAGRDGLRVAVNMLCYGLRE